MQLHSPIPIKPALEVGSTFSFPTNGQGAGLAQLPGLGYEWHPSCTVNGSPGIFAASTGHLKAQDRQSFKINWLSASAKARLSPSGPAKLVHVLFSFLSV